MNMNFGFTSIYVTDVGRKRALALNWVSDVALCVGSHFLNVYTTNPDIVNDLISSIGEEHVIYGHSISVKHSERSEPKF